MEKNVLIVKEYIRHVGSSKELARFDSIEDALAFIETARPQGLLYVQSVKREETKDV